MQTETATGAALRDAAHDLHRIHRAATLRAAKRVAVAALLGAGEFTIDDVRDAIDLPPEINPTVFGCVGKDLARDGICYADGFRKSRRAVAHARPNQVWRLIDRGAAERWLADHPEIGEPADDLPSLAGVA